MKPKILVCGYKNHGKGEFCRIANEAFGLTFQCSSRHMAPKIFPLMQGLYDSEEQCWKNRGQHRPFWFDRIAEYTMEEPDRLAREILMDHDGYDGMRRLAEFKESRKHFDLTIWIDATLRLGREDIDSNELDPKMFDLVISNNSSLSDFERRIHSIACLFR
jgi:hypothetical protein